MMFSFPDWFPLWAQLVLLACGAGLGLAFLLVPFAVFGVKGRLSEIELQLEEMRAELHVISTRLADGRAEPTLQPRRQTEWDPPRGEERPARQPEFRPVSTFPVSPPASPQSGIMSDDSNRPASLRSDPQQGYRPEYQPESQPGSRPESRPGLRSEPGREWRQETGRETRPEFRPEAQPDPYSQARPETPVEMRPAMRPDVRQEIPPEPYPEPRRELRSDRRPEIRAEIGPAFSPEARAERAAAQSPRPEPREVPGEFRRMPWHDNTPAAPPAAQQPPSPERSEPTRSEPVLRWPSRDPK